MDTEEQQNIELPRLQDLGPGSYRIKYGVGRVNIDQKKSGDLIIKVVELPEKR